MNNAKATSREMTFNGILLLALFIIQYTDGLMIHIGSAVPCLLIPAVLLMGIYFGWWTGGMFGLITGILMDCVSTDGSCFNSIVILVLAVAAGIMARYFFNDNLIARFVLTVLLTAVFYLLKWLIFYVFSGRSEPMAYLSVSIIPSFIFTAVLTVPLLFLVDFMNKTFNK